VFKSNSAWACSAILYETLSTASSRVIIKDSIFNNNEANNYCGVNNQCNRHGSICLFRNLENMDELIINEIVYNFGFEGFGRIYDSSCYFYRTEPIK
jgi:hypothetical protein